MATEEQKGMGSRPAIVQGAPLSDEGTETPGTGEPNVRDAVEKTTDMGAQTMGHGGTIDTPADGDRGVQHQDPARQQFEGQRGADFDKKDIIRPEKTAGKAEGGYIHPSGTGQTNPDTAP